MAEQTNRLRETSHHATGEDVNLLKLSANMEELSALQEPSAYEPVLNYVNGEWKLTFVGEKSTSEKWSSGDTQKMLKLATLGASFGKPGAILVPSHPEEYGTVKDLRERTIDYIERYVTLPANLALVVAVWIHHSWVYDAHDSTVYLRFRHPEGGMGKSRALKVGASISRRAMRLTGSTKIAAIKRDVTAFKPTIFLDEFDVNSARRSEWTMLMKSSFERDNQDRLCIGSSSNPNDWETDGQSVYVPKATSQHHRFDDDALESRFIDCYMVNRTGSVPSSINQAEMDREALTLRNMYLKLRLDTLESVDVDPSLVHSSLTDRSNQVALPLLSIATDEDERNAIINVMQDSQNRTLQDRRSSKWGVIVESLLSFQAGGGGNGNKLWYKGIAQRTGDPGIYPQTVGRCMRDFNIQSDHGREGTYAIVTAEDMERLKRYIQRN